MKQGNTDNHVLHQPSIMQQAATIEQNTKTLIYSLYKKQGISLEFARELSDQMAHMPGCCCVDIISPSNRGWTNIWLPVKVIESLRRDNWHVTVSYKLDMPKAALYNPALGINILVE